MAKEMFAEAAELDPAFGRMAAADDAPDTGEVLRVRDLIELLVLADPDAPVVVRGPYGGFDYVRSLAPRPLQLNVNSLNGFGRHDFPAGEDVPDTVAMVLLSEADETLLD